MSRELRIIVLQIVLGRFYYYFFFSKQKLSFKQLFFIYHDAMRIDILESVDQTLLNGISSRRISRRPQRFVATPRIRLTYVLFSFPLPGGLEVFQTHFNGPFQRRADFEPLVQERVQFLFHAHRGRGERHAVRSRPVHRDDRRGRRIDYRRIRFEVGLVILNS